MENLDLLRPFSTKCVRDMRTEMCLALYGLGSLSFEPIEIGPTLSACFQCASIRLTCFETVRPGLLTVIPRHPSVKKNDCLKMCPGLEDGNMPGA